MFEGDPSRPEYSSEILELLQHPEQVFDGDQNKAELEHQLVLKMFREWEGFTIQRSGVEVTIGNGSVESTSSSLPPITITWAKWIDGRGMALSLSPITAPGGPEGGAIAYMGTYGLASRNKAGVFVFSEDGKGAVKLEDLFRTPDGITLLIKPTVSRWAVGRDELSLLFGENTRTLYVGLGFLLSGIEGHKWMHVGLHESGHLHRGQNENAAWTWANKRYADLYRGKKELIGKILEGEVSSLFDILEGPRHGSDLTIGKITRFGLVSHALINNAVIPSFLATTF